MTSQESHINREGLITKKCKATHTKFILHCPSNVTFTKLLLAKIITVKLEPSLLLNVSICM